MLDKKKLLKHFTNEMLTLAGNWLVPLVLALYPRREVWSQNHLVAHKENIFEFCHQLGFESECWMERCNAEWRTSDGHH